MRTGVENALRAVATGVKPLAGGWRFAVRNGTEIAGRARIDEDWLHLTAWPDRVHRRANSAGAAWALLDVNGRLRGGARFAVEPSSGELSVGAFVALGEELHDAFDGLVRAASWLGGVDDEEPTDDAEPVDFAALGGEGGWTVTARGSGRFTANLDSAATATIGGGRVSVELVREDDVPPDARRAVALFLLELNHALRGARAARRAGAVVFESLLSKQPSAPELADALSACSVASSQGAGETRALLDEECARAFLELRGTRIAIKENTWTRR